MFLLRRILRLILLGYALYSFAYGIWLIIQTENTSPEEAQNSYALEEYGTTIPPGPNHTIERLTTMSNQVCEWQPLLSMSSSPPGVAIKHRSLP